MYTSLRRVSLIALAVFVAACGEEMVEPEVIEVGTPTGLASSA